MNGNIFLLTIVLINLLSSLVSQPNTTSSYDVSPVSNSISCQEMTAENLFICAEQEAQILDSVVRIRFHGQFEKGQHNDFRGNIGHATIMDGRYLITHNHYSIDLITLTAANNQGVTGFSLYNGYGMTIARKMSVESFTVAIVGEQTLILDFGNGYFDALGMASANVKPAAESTIEAGDEIAQIDWDAERAYVVWTTVLDIVFDEEAPYIEVDNFVMSGASGGGVFVNGIHIANNWADITITNKETGSVMQTYSLAALNEFDI